MHIETRNSMGVEIHLLSSELINKLYSSLTNIAKGEQITTLNIVLISTNLMQIVEKYPNINGEQKKALVIQVLARFTNDTLSGDDKIGVMLFINTFLPDIIDTIISVDKKQIIINIRKTFKSCFPCCK